MRRSVLTLALLASGLTPLAAEAQSSRGADVSPVAQATPAEVAKGTPGVATPSTTGAPIAPTAGPSSDPLTVKDRVALDAALVALTAGNADLAQEILSQLMLGGESGDARTAATVFLDRVIEWKHRRAAGIVAPLRPPMNPSLPTGPRATTGAKEASGRVPLLATTTLLGLGAWGWALPNMFGVRADDEGRGFLGLYMLTAGSSFAVPYLLTRADPPTPAQANLAFYGGTRGLEWGLLLSNLVFGKAGGDTSGQHDRAFAASLLFGSLSGVIGGALVADRFKYTPGQARTVAVGGDYGLFAGLVIGHLLGFDEIGEDCLPQTEPFFNCIMSKEDRDKRARATSAAGVVGTVAGLAGGRWLSLRRDNTWGDGEVMRGATLLGVLAAATVGVTAGLQPDEGDNSRPLLGMMLVGGGLGLAGGDWFVRKQSFTPGQAILIDLAGVAGALAGLGTTYLINPDLEAGPYMIATTVGAGLGGGIVAHLAASDPDGAVSAAGAGTPSFALLPSLGGHGRLGLRLLGSF